MPKKIKKPLFTEEELNLSVLPPPKYYVKDWSSRANLGHHCSWTLSASEVDQTIDIDQTHAKEMMKRVNDMIRSYKSYVLNNKVYSKTHSDGWTIYARVYNDYYSWIDEFAAIHPVYGNVYGDLSTRVKADSKEGYDNFMKNHPPEIFDADDI